MSFDLSFDYRQKCEISFKTALNKAYFLEHIEGAKPKYQAFKTCLYIQKELKKEGYQSPLTPLIQNVKLYDKQEKNKLEKPLTRLEFCFLA